MSNELKLIQMKVQKLETALKEAESEKAQLIGRLEVLNSQLEKDFGCKSLEAADALFEEKEKRIEELEQTRNALQEELDKILSTLT